MIRSVIRQRQQSVGMTFLMKFTRSAEGGRIHEKEKGDQEVLGAKITAEKGLAEGRSPDFSRNQN